MRGLDIRVLYARAKVAAVIDAVKGDEDMANVLAFASDEGRQDYRNGVPRFPTMFADVPALINAWRAGYKDAGECAEMDACPHCSSCCGDPCPTHD
jgi:hypothetical protein